MCVPCCAQAVINTDLVKCVIPIIMVQLETAPGNNSALFVHTETFLHCNALFFQQRGALQGPVLRNLRQNCKNSANRKNRSGWWVCVRG